MKKKKTAKTVEKAKIYITATFNNTIITISDEKGNPLVIGSCGMHGFSGTRKSTPYAATITIDSALKKAMSEYGIKRVDVFIKGIGPGREASLRVIKGSEVELDKIVDVTPIPHNGVRPPKIRRV
ncbi:MAG: 30S ribosomal protein S11 [Candidatus Roizmanbacteria bacterium]|nr:MAG: 30S ribosomal protein S11 [Candidatus Roizmanbacteria bacterium]